MKGLGIGIDIVEINRFKKLPYKQHKSFYTKIFSTSEINHCLKYKNSSLHFASKFAIKEAVIKSICDNVEMKSIITDYNARKPVVTLTRSKSYDFLISVSHEKDYAIAVVISHLRKNY